MLGVGLTLAASATVAAIAEAAGGTAYTVRPGDTISDIASSHGVDDRSLVEANGLANPDSLQIGQQITIPDVSPTAVPAPASAAATPAGATYVVRPGDTLLDIALAYDVDDQALAQANGIGDPTTLQIGQRLTIPGAQDQVAPVVPSNLATAPYRSQFDGSAYEESNCGPATLGMFLGHFGANVSTATLRDSANRQMGIWSPDAGTTWEALAYAAKVQGFAQVGLYASGSSYRKWTTDDILGDQPVGRPAMVLVRFRALPGHETSGFYGDHYILILGKNAGGSVVYHDAAFRDGTGANRTMTVAQFDRAWASTSVGLIRTGMGLKSS